MSKRAVTKKVTNRGKMSKRAVTKKVRNGEKALKIKDKKLKNLKVTIKKKQKALAYRRISTRTNKDKAGIRRQFSACKDIAEKRGFTLVDSINEVISGSLPTDGREVFNKLLQRAVDEDIGHVLIENNRALARDADVLSDFHKKAKAAGITIIGGDTPQTADNPVAKFQCRVMWAYTELEKELAVHRMQHGLKERQKDMIKMLKSFDIQDTSNKALQEKAQFTTQDGKVKYNGSPSILQSCMPLTKRKIDCLQLACRRHDAKKIGWRALASRFSDILRQNIKSHETARRMKKEIQTSFGRVR